jgi:hypothetical protein
MVGIEVCQAIVNNYFRSSLIVVCSRDFSTRFSLRSFNDEASRKGAKEPKKLSLPSLSFVHRFIYVGATAVGGLTFNNFFKGC